MKRLLLRNSAGFTLAVSLCLLAPVGVCQTSQNGTGAQTNAGEKSDPRELPMPVDLIRGGAVGFPVASPSVIEVGAKCDSNGNMYAVWSSAPPTVDGTVAGRALMAPISTASEPLRELVLKSKDVVTYTMPPIPDYPHQLRWSYNVAPDGTLFVLVRASREGPSKESRAAVYFIEKFKSDGSLDSRAQLEGSSDDFEPYNFAVFADGRFLILGMAGTNEKPGEWSPFAGIFDSQGQFVTRVEFATDSAVKYPEMAQESDGKSNIAGGPFLAVDLSSMMSDPDGDVYIGLAGSPMQIIVVSPSGQVGREIKLKAPFAGLVSAESGVAESGFMYVHFRHVNGAPPTVPGGLIGTVNLSTGQYDRLYKLPASAESRAVGVCGDSEGEFFLIESNPKGKLTIAKYSAD